MASPNLQIPDVQANQNQKEVTINNAVAALDNAMNSTLAIAVSGSFDFTTDHTRGNAVLDLTGTPGAAFTADMPDANARVMFIRNSTDSLCTIRNSAGAGTGQPLLIPGSFALIVYDGTDFFSLQLGGGSGNPPRDETGTSYTAAAGDTLAFIRFTNSSGVTFTIPPNSSVPFPIGSVLQYEQGGAGTVTAAQGAGVTLHSRGGLLATAGLYSVVQIKKTATDRWVVIGDVA